MHEQIWLTFILKPAFALVSINMTLRSRALASPSSIDTCLSNQPQDPKDDINEQKITCFDINEQKIQQVLSNFFKLFCS
jgi:hypothetical protein